MLRASDSVESGNTEDWKKFYSIDFSSQEAAVGLLPYLTIVYRNINGLESYWDYTSASAGRAGTGYVNNYSGNLVWVRGDMGFGGNLMPVSISHVYNTNDSDTNEYGMGYGWRTNFNQTVKAVTLPEDASAIDASYVWTDGDGTKHYFIEDSGTYVDEDGLELTLTVSDSGYTITDKYGNKSIFNSSGNLTQMVNNQKTPSSITVSYHDGLISQIKDGAGRIYQFTYSSGLLSRIGYYGSGSEEIAYVTFGYSSSKLTSVTDQDGKASSYTYSDYLLTKATDIDGYNIRYTYTSGTPKRVASVTEYDGSTKGSSLTLEYAHNQTTFTDHDGNIQITQFNDWGNVISVQDGQGRAEFAQYAWHDREDPETVALENPKANQLRLASKLQNTVVNLLTDTSFESDVPWSGAVSASADEAYMGSNSMLVTATAEGAAAYGASVSVPAGQTLTFSAYVKTGTAGASLGLGTTSASYVTSEELAAGSGWTRLQVSYTNSGDSAVTIRPQVVTAAAGTVYLDCVQAEFAPTASRYNMVENGDFLYGEDGWTRGSHFTTTEVCTTATSAAPQLSNNVYKITGNAEKAKHLYQRIYVSGEAGDTYVLSAWAKGDSVPLTGSRQFSMVAYFNDTDGSRTKCVVQFNPDADSSISWQYAATAIVADKAYTSINIDFQYDYNVNSVYVDGIQLFREEFGSSYTYDADGNVISVTDLQNQTTTYEYTDNNLTKIIQNGNAKLTYTYDSYHNVKTATTQEGVAYEFTYDDWGNNTAVSIVSGTTKITAEAVYSADGNRLEKTVDALDKVTNYCYNENTNVLEWVQYPEDTQATRTEYSYDTMYRLASAAADTDTGLALSASYTYADDLLTAIQTPSTTYSFTYGSFAQRTGIQVGSQTLATYTYSDDQNRRLTGLTYGNGDSVTYEYDDQGRVVKETFEDGDTVTYTYDNTGALATVTDSESGITTTYYYDLTDRMMKYVETGEGYSHSVGYEYDTLNNLTKLVETINGVKYSSSYFYDGDNRLTSITFDESMSIVYEYDAFGRVSKVTREIRDTYSKVADSYIYTEPEAGYTSAQIATHQITADGYSHTDSYTYDDNGNILSVSDGTNTTAYVYDSANQLVRENNQAAGKTWTWTYDNAGNILSRGEYAYTTGELGTPTKVVVYGYGSDDWGDLLTAYDGNTITYDGIGNPLSDGIWTYTWQNGRQLVEMYREDVGGGENDVTVTYTYDANGMRIGKTVTTNTYHAHSYTAVVTAPTCTVDGYTTYTCACGDSYVGDVTDATGHTYTETVTAPTCTVDGYTTYTCACGDSYTGNTTAALGHELAETAVDGSVLYTCTRCDYTATHVHSYTAAVTAPTCTVDGYTTYTCSCGDSYQGDVVAATGHNGSFLISEPATCTEDGYEDYYCQTCGEVYTIVLPAPGHTWTDGGLVPYCTVCNYGRSDGDPIFWSLRNTNLISTVEETYSYVYNGSKLTQMTKDSTSLLFVYDASGRPSELRYNNVYYHYVTNLQGDVIAILDEYGAVVVEYSYDAWGNILTVTGSMAATLGKLNPLTYRGYVYDWETGLYYLQSRYYNPERGRFINADNYPTTGQEFAGNNMFAYCGNNPVARADDGGEFWHIIAGAVVGAVVGVISTVVTNAIENKPLDEGLGTAALSGAASGALAATGVGTVGMIVGNAAISMGQNALNQVIENNGFDNFDVGDMLIDGAIGAASGAMGGAGSGSTHLTNLGKQSVKRVANATVHNGVKAGFKEAGKAAVYYGKNTAKYYKDFVIGIPMDIVASTGTAIFSMDSMKAQYRSWLSGQR